MRGYYLRQSIQDVVIALTARSKLYSCIADNSVEFLNSNSRGYAARKLIKLVKDFLGGHHALTAFLHVKEK